MRISIIFLLPALAVLMVVAGYFVNISLTDLPSIDALKDYQPPQSTMVFDRNGDLIGRFYDERRTVISVKDLPDKVKLAFVAAEDGDFFEHRGIDYIALIRAVMLEIKYRTIGGARVGGSTITQQAARTMLLSSSQTYGRKLREMVLAHRIENALTKDQILHLYLNQIYFGNGAYGIEEASLTYFLKHAKKLTLGEAAALASIPKSPNRINPFGDAERLRVRQAYVLEQMVKNKFITLQEADDAKAAPLFSDTVDATTPRLAPYFLQAVKAELVAKVPPQMIATGGAKVYSTLDISMQHAAEESLKAGLRVIDKRTGYRGPILRPTKDEEKKIQTALDAFRKRAFTKENKKKIWDLSTLTKNILNGPPNAVFDKIRITTLTRNKIIGVEVLSIDDKANVAIVDLGSSKARLPFASLAWARSGKAAPKKVSEVLKPNDIILVKIERVEQENIVSLEQEPVVNGGLVALDVATGGVLAMVGGYNFDRSPFNRIMQAKRQPGSGIKPLIYSLALDREITVGNGTLTAASIITDVPKAFYDPGTEEFWRPRNHTNRYLGDITLRRCLRSSVNTCTITLLEKLGIDTFLQFAKDVELNTNEMPYPRNLTIALGSAENYPITVANAMRVLANNGKYSPYYLIDRYKEKSGAVKSLFTLQEKSVLRPESTYIVSQILREVVSDGKRSAYLSDVQAQLSGKTGTTNNARSAWFFGYSPKVLALVYVGYDDNRSIGSDEWGATTAFPIWGRFMNSVASNREPLRFAQPENIEWRWVDRESGRAIEMDDDEKRESSLLEAFIAGTAPAYSGDEVVKAPNTFDESGFAP